MLRANIYCVEALPDERTRAINEGLDLLGQRIGQTISPKNLRVRLPMTKAGKVDPERVGYNKLPKATDLHIFAVPLVGSVHHKQLGVAYASTGVSYVDTAQSKEITRAATAHEAAHSLGFVLARAGQADPKSAMHCCDGGCIMHKDLITDTRGHLLPSSARKTKPGPVSSLGPTREQFGLPQEDFCIPCQTDMNDFGYRNIFMLRALRLVTGNIVPTIAMPINLPQSQ